MAHPLRSPLHARSGQGSRMCAALTKARPDNRAPSRALCRITDACPKVARLVHPAPLDRHCPTPAGPSPSTNPHNAAYAARGFLHVRISYAQAPEILRLSCHSQLQFVRSKPAVHSRPGDCAFWPICDAQLLENQPPFMRITTLNRCPILRALLPM